MPQDPAVPKEQEFLIGVFWGAFDPPTKAHVAIIEKALVLPFIHHLIVVLNNNSYKEYAIPFETRKEELQAALAPLHLEKITLLEQDDAHPLNFAAWKRSHRGLFAPSPAMMLMKDGQVTQTVKSAHIIKRSRLFQEEIRSRSCLTRMHFFFPSILL